MTNNDWIKELKIGDKVCLDRDSIGIVAKITKTMIILTNAMRFNINSGFSTGNNLYGSHYIEQLTPEKISAINKKRIIKFVVNFKYDSLTDEQKLQVYELLKSFDKC